MNTSTLFRLTSILVVSSAVAASPSSETPAVFRDGPSEADLAGRTRASAELITAGEWWKLFADAMLDDLVDRALANNQDLRAAAARVEQARAASGLARSTYWPQLAVNGGTVRERTSSSTEIVFPDTLTSTVRAPLFASWEIDLFGRVRHLNAATRAEAEATAATFEAVRLVLTAEVASNYFTLRALDQEHAVIRDSVGLRRRARELAQVRLANGVAAEFDVARADAELASTEAEAAEIANRRAAMQNALAVLVGTDAPSFEMPTERSSISILPEVPAGLPASLLERRPDVVAAERTLAAANARIGVARAAFFPAISLTGSAGFASGELDGLFRGDSRIWSIGPSVYLPIFQGGRNRANLARSRAVQEESLAQFRQQVLVAFREVQDALIAIRFLGEQAAAQERALTASRRAAQLAQTRYDAGLVAFIEVIDAQRTTLNVERVSVQLGALRRNASVALIKALGGGWDFNRNNSTSGSVRPVEDRLAADDSKPTRILR